MHHSRTMSATILILDDEPAIRTVLEIAFQTSGYRVITAADGRSALLCDAPCDAAVLDVNMPDTNGLVVATQLLARDPALPIWLMTGSWREDTLKRAAELGVAILRKPFKFEHLVGDVGRRLEIVRGASD
jgi:DNA-binding response OmpR family regulator